MSRIKDYFKTLNLCKVLRLTNNYKFTEYIIIHYKKSSTLRLLVLDIQNYFYLFITTILTMLISK